ncbi:MAG TPA: ABC transporter ATP-binding protein [Legionellaceae bacterium]|nr:ABC transporter ATP-binding protein [Legionellaceae bacterium]
MDALLTSNNLYKTYSNDENKVYHILKNINITIRKGEFVSLMGPSGSGKSTLLYHLSGMDQGTSGRVIFDGQELSSLSEMQLAHLRLNKMGFIFQHIHLLKNLSLFDNIIFSAYLAKKNTRKHINSKADTLMKKMGISHLANHSITQASGGQLQRAAISRALINDPLMIFGDEPTGALDSKSAQDIIDILIDLNREGTTFLLATHDLKVAAKAERVIYILDGEVVDEKRLGKFEHTSDASEREQQISAWLMTVGNN